ncbi:MAG: SIMPL domain-containing protein [Alphaproteobacteria bacterium]|nr:SIMPL domain-containing protein [Alphaproteobacteria bacterium]
MTMKSRNFFLTLAVVALASTIVPANAHEHGPQKRTISLAATGTVKAEPDKVDITTGVTSEALTARDALDKNSRAMAKVVEALKGEGIEAKDIQTTNFSVYPVYEERKEGKAPFISGYRVVNSVHIGLRDTKKLGAILDKVVSLGANTIDSIEFSVAEPEALKDDARKRAMENAIANAELYAEAADVKLGSVLTIVEEDAFIPPYGRAAKARMEMAAPDVPIEAGTTAIEVRVRVTWELE